MADTATLAQPAASCSQPGSTIADRVARGLAWLDANDPGWWREDVKPQQPGGGPIDVDRLSMSNACYCVLGFRWGLYYRAPISLEEAVACGFDATDAALERATDGDYQAADAEFGALTFEWARVITERREAAR